MKKLIKTPSRILFSAAIAATTLLPLSEVQAQVVYSNGFDGLPTGLVDDGQIKTNWSSRYAKGPDEGRVEIVTDSQSGKAGRIKYPAFGNQSSPSGATWETDIGVSSDELYMAYWIKFDSNFQFVKGGKLPGLAGSTSFPYGDNDFTTRLMWRENGKLEFYLHGFKMNNNAGSEPYRVFWDDFGEHARVIPGQWHHIEIRQKLNTPGALNGRLQGWLDGVLMIDDISNSGVRDAGQNSTKINQLYFSTFFGGSSAPEIQWQPTNDVYATYDEFIVSNQRIGMSGFPGDIGGGGGTGGNSAPSVNFSSPSNNLTVDEGYDTMFVASASDSDGSISNLQLFIDNNLIRQENSAPYEWGHNGSPNPTEVNGLSVGTHDVRVVATDDEGASSEDSFTLTVLANGDTGGDTGGGDTGSCQSLAVGNIKHEISIAGSNCIEFNSDVSGRSVAVWDSDANSSCNFRGSVSSVNGSGSLNVPDNYEATNTLSGTKFSISNASGNSCQFLKIRAL